MLFKTTDIIRTVFAMLMKEKSVNKIYVKDVAERCEMSRNTFYYYYKSIDDLVKEVMNIYVRSCPAEGAPSCAFDCVRPYVEGCLSHKEEILAFYDSKYRPMLIEILESLVREKLTDYMRSLVLTGKLEAAKAEVISRSLLRLMMGSVDRWLFEQMSFDLSEMKEILENFRASSR